MSLSDRIDRWRHVRGFGVHSPAAFMLVKEVVRPARRYRYYAEDRIDVARISPADRLMLRLAVRLYGCLHGYSFSLNANPGLPKILKRAGLKVDATPSKQPCTPDPFARINFRGALGEGEAIVYKPVTNLDECQFEALFPYSLVFDSPRFLIVYKTEGLTFQRITLP